MGELRALLLLLQGFSFMDSICCAVFDEALAKALGKRESESDLEFYHRAYNERVLTFIYPRGYPEKINPLLQALHIADYVLLSVEKIDASLGETILAIDSLGKGRGFLIVGGAVDESMLKKIIAGTVIEKFERIGKDCVLEKLAKAETRKAEGKTAIDIDAMFDVRGLGVVALGFVAQGKVAKFPQLGAVPLNANVVVKSIQKQDKDFAEAACNDRVGLALKGIETKDFSRGIVLTDDPEFKSAKEFEIAFEKNRFYKKEIAQNAQLHIQCRLQVAGCVVKGIAGAGRIAVETGRPVAIRHGEAVVLVDVNSKPRIAGKGKVMSKTTN